MAVEVSSDEASLCPDRLHQAANAAECGSPFSCCRPGRVWSRYSDQIPGDSIKLDRDSDTPSTEKRKTQKETVAKPREPERTPRQVTRKPPKEEQTDKGVSPETGRAIETVIEFGLGGRLGMGGHGEDRGTMGGRGMRDR